MKKVKILWLCVSLLLLAVPVVQTLAFDDEVEIELFEVSGFMEVVEQRLHNLQISVPPSPAATSPLRLLIRTR